MFVCACQESGVLVGVMSGELGEMWVPVAVGALEPQVNLLHFTDIM